MTLKRVWIICCIACVAAFAAFGTMATISLAIDVYKDAFVCEVKR